MFVSMWMTREVLTLAPTAKLGEIATRMARARIRRRYGAISAREMQLRLASLWLDAETMRKVFGWDPDVNGY